MRTLAYKYRSNIDIRQDTFSLLENRIYASPLSQLNDPFEVTILNLLASRLKESNQSKHLNELVNKIKSTIGIYSLSKPQNEQIIYFPNNELMWAHYANSHKGFCIEYDVDLLMDNYLLPKKVNKLDVKYNKLNDYSVKDILQTHNGFQSLLGMKSTSWQYENEIRLIFDEAGIKTYPPDALKAVYFGLKMSSKEREMTSPK